MSTTARIRIGLILIVLLGLLLFFLAFFEKDNTRILTYAEVMKGRILSQLTSSIEKASDNADNVRVEIDYYIHNRSDLVAFYHAIERSKPYLYDDYYADHTYSATPAMPPRHIWFPDFKYHFNIAPNLLILFVQKEVLISLVFEITEGEYEKLMDIIRPIDYFK